MTVSKTLRHHLNADERTLYRIAKESGISHSSLFKFANGSGLRAEQFDKLCAFYGFELVLSKKSSAKGK